jgi:hypothetical protein
MCWQCDNPDKTRADYLDLLRGKIKTYGWAVQYVEGKRPWAYTIGMHDRGSPEFLVTGLSPARALWLLNTFAKRIVRTQRVPVPGERISLPAGTRVEVVEVPHPDAHMGIAVDIHRRPFRAMQLVWADDRGRWPWSADFDDGRGSQPVVGARAQKA